jgi:hypothetical protein
VLHLDEATRTRVDMRIRQSEALQAALAILVARVGRRTPSRAGRARSKYDPPNRPCLNLAQRAVTTWWLWLTFAATWPCWQAVRRM